MYIKLIKANGITPFTKLYIMKPYSQCYNESIVSYIF